MLARLSAAERAHVRLAGEITALHPRLTAVSARCSAAAAVAKSRQQSISTSAAAAKNRKQRAKGRRAEKSDAAAAAIGSGGSGGGGSSAYEVEVLGEIRSCFKQKFGIPRQPGLAPLAVGELVLKKPWSTPDAVRGLEGWSHIWITFIFHGVQLGKQFKATVNCVVRLEVKGGGVILITSTYLLSVPWFVHSAILRAMLNGTPLFQHAKSHVPSHIRTHYLLMLY